MYYNLYECPECCSADIVYDEIEYDSNILSQEGVKFPGTCNICGCEFEECYTLEYSSCIILKEGTELEIE